MPLYEYECANGHRFENIQKFSDPPVTACPTCDAPVQKLMSSPAFQFKGTGWYITDYARKGGGKDGKGESGRTGEGAKSEGGKDAGSSGDKAATSTGSAKDSGGTKS